MTKVGNLRRGSIAVREALETGLYPVILPAMPD